MASTAIISLSLITLVVASTCSDNPSFHRFSFGGVNGVVVSDGPAIFTQNPFIGLPSAALERSYAASFRSVSPAIFQQNVVILDIPESRIMVDAGSVNIPEFPQFENAGKLIENMKGAGISPESIDAIIFTHAHADHVSGIITQDGKVSFPNAKIYIGEREHKFWSTIPVPNPKPLIIPNETIGMFWRHFGMRKR